MGLPIPAILQKAANVIGCAKKAVAAMKDKPDEDKMADLSKALSEVTSDDLLAVLNEVGKVYMGVHNPVIQQFGTRANPQSGMIEIVIMMNFGLGFVPVTAGLPKKNAEEFLKNLSVNLTELSVLDPKSSSQRIISNPAEM